MQIPNVSFISTWGDALKGHNKSHPAWWATSILSKGAEKPQKQTIKKKDSPLSKISMARRINIYTKGEETPINTRDAQYISQHISIGWCLLKIKTSALVLCINLGQYCPPICRFESIFKGSSTGANNLTNNLTTEVMEMIALNDHPISMVEDEGF